MNCASDFSPVDSASTEACAVSRKCAMEVARGPLVPLATFVDDLLGRARIGEGDLVERQPEIGAGKGERVEAGLTTAPGHPKRIVSHLMRPAVDRLANSRTHSLADGGAAEKVIATAWLIRKTQQWRCQEGAER